MRNLDVLRRWNPIQLLTIAYSGWKYDDTAIGKNYCIQKMIEPVLKKYRNNQLYKNKGEDENTKKLKVWMLWWQGADQMPPMISLCYKSILKSFDGVAEVVLLTEKNIFEYVSLPDYIEEKRKCGIITLTHYSDIVRFHLMNKFGGLWIDATYYAANKAPKDIFTHQMYTIRIPHPEVKCNNDFIWYDWAGNFMKLPKGSTLGNFMEEAFLYYWRNHNVLMEYYFIDHLIRIAYENIPGIKEEIQSCGYNNIFTHKLLPLLNQTDSVEEFEKIKAETTFFKLTTKTEYVAVTDDGEETLFGKLISEIGGEDGK